MARGVSNSGSFRFVLRALRHRNYRLFFLGQIVSLTGTWMSNTATGWLVYRLSGSALLLGVVGFAGQFPAFLLTSFAGVYVDRWNRHRLLIATQTFSMLQSFALAFLTLSGRITVQWIVALSVLQGLINAFDMPCRQAFVADMVVQKEDLPNAIALNSSLFNMARLVGPSMAGLVIASRGEGWCFLADGASFIAVVFALSRMTIPAPSGQNRSRAGIWQELEEGWRYAAGFAPIRAIIALMALTSLVAMPYVVLVPVFAGKILKGGPHTLGFLMAAVGGGALLGALWLAVRKSVLGLGRVIAVSTVIFGCGLIFFSLSRVLWISLLILVATGFGFMTQMASSNTILQTIVEDKMRGRVMSIFITAFLGTAPFGSILAGALAEKIGAPHTLLIGGMSCLAGAAWFARQLPALRRIVRPIYVRMGIIPEVAQGLGNAAALSARPEG